MNRGGTSSALKTVARGAARTGNNKHVAAAVHLQQQQRAFIKPAYDLAKKVRQEKEREMEL